MDQVSSQIPGVHVFDLKTNSLAESLDFSSIFSTLATSSRVVGEVSIPSSSAVTCRLCNGVPICNLQAVKFLQLQFLLNCFKSVRNLHWTYAVESCFQIELLKCFLNHHHPKSSHSYPLQGHTYPAIDDKELGWIVQVV